MTEKADGGTERSDNSGAPSERRLLRPTTIAIVALGLAFAAAAGFGVRAELQRREAEQRLEEAFALTSEVVFTIGWDLEPIRGASAVRGDLLERTSQLQDKLIEGQLDTLDDMRRAMVKHIHVGEVAASHDNLAVARREYEAALAFARQLAKNAPAEPRYKRALSLADKRLGDVALSAGNLGAARGYYDQALKVAQMLSQADAENAAYQRDLWVSYGQMARVSEAQGDLAAARGYYQQGLEAAKQLAAGAKDGDASRDLALTYQKLGDVAQARGDMKEAQEHYAAAQALAKPLAEASPNDAALARLVGLGEEKLGDVALATGDLPAARAFYERGLAIAKELAGKSAEDQKLQLDLAMGHLKLARVLPDPAAEDARAHRAEARRILADLEGKTPRSGQYADVKAEADRLPD